MTDTVYINNREIIKTNIINLMVDDLLNGWAGELMDESLNCMQRWLKLMM
jgi:hypothetical protein